VIEDSLTTRHPVQIPLNAPFAIPGLSNVLTQMPVGSSWVVWMPASLAYGDLGRGPVPPGAALKFNVELVSIVTNSIVTDTPPAAPSAADIEKGEKPSIIPTMDHY
jgi:hypothetical protein